jgi:hypothetical protein
MYLKRFGKSVLALACIVSFIGGCAAGPSKLAYPTGQTLKITKNTWSIYQEYLASQGGFRKEGAFLAVLEGDVGVSGRYSYCPPSYDGCTFGPGAINWANKLCIQDQLTCVLFARGSNIVVPYKIID